MKINTRRQLPAISTHEGAPARRIGDLAQLRRTVSSCLLWESEFYEDGESISARIAALVHDCDPVEVAALAVEVRTKMNLRHVPLLIVRELARHPKRPARLVATTLAQTIQRADELSEFMAIYWKDGKRPLSKQVKRGLAWALRKFSEHELAKYNRDAAVKLRDVLFLTHAKPKDAEQAALWKRLASNELAIPDTWEVALSAGADKKATFERLIREGRFGYLALLRNLRNMIAAGCDAGLVTQAIRDRKGAERVLPFRFIAAAKHAPQFEPDLDESMQIAMQSLERLPGRTLVLVDNSGSMGAALSGKSDLLRTDAAAGLAILVRGVSEQCRVLSFANDVTEVPARQGMALRDAIRQTLSGGTYLGKAVTVANAAGYDRLIVITDEQSHDPVPNPVGRGYMINVASARNGVGYGPWVHIDGFSESVVRFIAEHERAADHPGDGHVA